MVRKTMNNHGVTLVALIITIIVMLILAGVSISLVIGENGVLEQARTAGTKQDEGAENEYITLAAAAALTRSLEDQKDGIDKAMLQDELDKLTEVEFTENYSIPDPGENEDFYMITLKNDHKYKISFSGKVERLE